MFEIMKHCASLRRNGIARTLLLAGIQSCRSQLRQIKFIRDINRYNSLQCNKAVFSLHEHEISMLNKMLQ